MLPESLDEISLPYHDEGELRATTCAAQGVEQEYSAPSQSQRRTKLAEGTSQQDQGDHPNPSLRLPFEQWSVVFSLREIHESTSLDR
jgi:hypothetical protein